MRLAINISSLAGLSTFSNPGASLDLLTLGRPDLLRRELGLHEEQQIITAARFRIGA